MVPEVSSSTVAQKVTLLFKLYTALVWYLYFDITTQVNTGTQCWHNSNTNHFGIIPIVPSHVSTN